MKKQLSTAMAAAMAFGTVVPAFAAETKATVQSGKIDVRTSRGMEIAEIDVVRNNQTTKATVVNREEVYNYNGFSANDRAKHTLKNAYKDMQVLFIQENPNDANKDQVVLGKKIDPKNTALNVQIATEKAKYDATLAQIEALEKNGYRKTVDPQVPTIKDGKYIAGKQIVTLVPKDTTLGLNSYEFIFDNLDSGLVTDTDVNTLRKEVFTSLNLKNTTGVTVGNSDIEVNFTTESAGAYAAANKLKFAIENNIAKFDIVSDEAGVGNKDRVVKLYVKGAQKNASSLVMTLTFKDVKKVDANKIVDMPLLKDSDFKGHWAESTIVNAMLSGYVDASTTFRPKDSVTRAEFAKMLCTVLNIPVKKGQEEPFHDVASNAWYHKYIAALYNAGGKQGAIVNGYADSTFKPNSAITRQEAAKMIAQAFVVTGNDIVKSMKVENNEGKLVTTKGTVSSIECTVSANGTTLDIDSKTSFKDDAEIKAWADASVESLKEVGVIKGYDDKTFKPNNSITRVEALLMITGENRK